MTFTDWTSTRRGLHSAAQIIEKLRKPFMPRDEKMFLHLALPVHHQGLTSGIVNEFGELILDFEAAALRLTPPSAESVTITLNGQTSTEVYHQLAAHITGAPPEWDGDADTFTIDHTKAAHYRDVLTTLDKALHTFQRELNTGVTSPVVVWPHGFDIAFSWFRGSEVDEHQPHIAFGFSPHSAGFDQPYFYSYAYPWPNDLPPEAPGLMRWSDAEWNGLVADYPTLADNLYTNTLAQCRLAYALFF